MAEWKEWGRVGEGAHNKDNDDGEEDEGEEDEKEYEGGC